MTEDDRRLIMSSGCVAGGVSSDSLVNGSLHGSIKVTERFFEMGEAF